MGWLREILGLWRDVKSEMKNYDGWDWRKWRVVLIEVEGWSGEFGWEEEENVLMNFEWMYRLPNVLRKKIQKF